MSGRLRPYPEYRDSGVNWLGSVPIHWDVVRNGRLFVERHETGFPDLPILEVSLRTGVRVRDMETGRKQQLADRAKYKRAAQGDIAYNIMRMWQGAVGVAPCDGLISPAYVVASPLPGVEPRFYTYLFRTTAYMREVNIASRGIVPDRNRLYWQYFKPLLSPLPPPEEQGHIADFLDGYTSQVQRLVAAKRRTIAVLTERARSIITDEIYAVSVDHEPRPRDEGWAVRAIKRVASISFSSVDKHIHAHERPVRVCNYVDVYKNDKISSETILGVGSVTTSELENYSVRHGDVIITKDSEDWRDICVPCLIEGDLPETVCGYHLAILRPKPGCLSGEYLYYALLAAPTTWQFHRAATGITRYGIGKNDIGVATIPLPPLAAQAAVCLKLSTALASINATKARVAREIDLILEYRDAVIEGVVTGRLDARAAELPPIDLVDLTKTSLADVEDMEDALEPVD